MHKRGLILFVDDEYYVLQTLKAILRRDFKNYNLEFAESGSEALDLLETFEKEELDEIVVFSDWMMPGMKGDDLLIKIHTRYPQSINFLLSGMINKAPEKEIFKKGGIKQVIQKPWKNEHLVSLLRDVLKVN